MYYACMSSPQPLHKCRHSSLHAPHTFEYMNGTPSCFSPLTLGSPLHYKAMADRHAGQVSAWPRPQRPATSETTADSGDVSPLRRRLQEHAPNSAQLIGFLTLVISGAILFLLTGLTLTGTVMGLILFGPVLLLSSPVWVPVALVVFTAAAGMLSACGFGVAILASASWMYKYYMGRHPIGSDRVDYARSRIADTASHVKDYAKEYGGYLQNRVKDTAPGA